MSDRNKVYETILLITNKDTMEEFKDMSVNDVLACNEGYYFERLLIGIDEEGNSKIVWDMKTDKEEIEGQRIHVHLLNGKRVDFFAELTNSTGFHAELINCSKEQYNGNRIYLPQDNSFGMDELDFFIFLGEKSKVIEGSFDEDGNLKATVEQSDATKKSEDVDHLRYLIEKYEDSEAPKIERVGGEVLAVIKTKQKMKLHELIEWGFENEVKNKQYVCEQNDSKVVEFNLFGNLEFSSNFSFSLADTYEVELLEEITEVTRIWQFIELTDEGLLGRTYLHKNESIENVKTDNSKAFYFLKEDLSAILIWKK